ncbi:MAG: cytochrome c3 family protein [Desulfobulbaceae bacterium]|nr:cytochrome c3 family protein [Desulfobulbaceae bacterium]
MKRAKIHLRTLITAVLLTLLGTTAGMTQETPQEAQPVPQNKYGECLDCHDYTLDHHPVDIPPPGDIPFPLTDGNITCLTCHFEDHESGGAFFLRGGPYLQGRDMCFKCHHSEDYAGINPHLMLEEDGSFKKIVGGQTICIVCHVTKPDPEEDRTEDVRFRADVGFLCWRCHPPMANALFQHEHLLVEPSLEMRRMLEKNEKEMNVLLPLVPRDRVTCSTCHNPHQKGVILREAAAKGADDPERLRVPSPRLCFICHPF